MRKRRLAVTLSIEENNKIDYTLIHSGSIPASVVFFPTRHVASITRYLTDCRSKKHKIFWKILHSFATVNKFAHEKKQRARYCQK